MCHILIFEHVTYFSSGSHSFDTALEYKPHRFLNVNIKQLVEQ